MARGAGAVARVGFTVSLFIAALAFTDTTQQAHAKIGILGGSLVAAVIGAALLRGDASASATRPGGEHRPSAQ